MLNDSYLAYDTTDLSEAEEYSSAFWGGKQNLILKGETFRSRVHSAMWGRIRLTHVETEGDVTVTCEGAHPGYTLQFWLAGKAMLLSPQREIQMRPGDLFVGPTGGSSTAHINECSSALVVTCDRRSLDGHLEVLLDQRLRDPLEFQPLLSYREMPGLQVFRFVRFLINELNQEEPVITHSPGTARQLETGFYSLVLESLPHSYRDRLRKLLTNGTRNWRWPFSIN